MYLKCWTQLNVQPPLNASLLKSAIPGSQKSCRGDYLTLVGVCMLSCSVVSDSFATPWDCSLPGSSVHGIFQARIQEWIAISSFRGSCWPRDWTHISQVSWRWEAHSLPLSHWEDSRGHNKVRTKKALFRFWQVSPGKINPVSGQSDETFRIYCSQAGQRDTFIKSILIFSLSWILWWAHHKNSWECIAQ